VHTEMLQRHTLVTPSPRAWMDLLAARPGLAREDLVRGWGPAGYPLVVRRKEPDDPPDAVPVGLPLPPGHGKRRIALHLPPDAILRVNSPPLLRDVAGAAPPAWLATLRDLLEIDSQVRVFGSLAWQHLTGLPYLSEGSDLDLLWALPGHGNVAALLAGIAAIDGHSPMRIDGEIAGIAGGVSWRELHSQGEVLVKSPAGVQLMSREAYLSASAA
jgi:phosphoribosyl-dephospho-CoA transferase